MALFLGYDPGGSGRNGVAAARIRIDGTVLGAFMTMKAGLVIRSCAFSRRYTEASETK